MQNNKTQKKEFRLEVLKTQLTTIVEKFQATAMEWLKETHNMANVSAETKIHPNQIMTELRTRLKLYLNIK